MADRRERVILELVDNGFASGMAKDAAATALLERQLDSLNGKTVDTDRSLASAAMSTDRFAASSRSAGADIDRFSGRLGLMLKGAAALGPAILPLGAVGAAGVAALASQLGFAAVGAGTLVTAFQGVGTALEAVNKAAMDGSAENLIAAADAMERLDPAAQAFVARFQELRPVFDDIRNNAAAGWFPGLTEALDDVALMAPRIGDLFETIGRAGGGLAEDLGGWLSGPEGREFLDFVAAEAPAAIEALGHSVGNLGAGMLDLWQAFAPTNAAFGDWLESTTQSFAKWADGVGETEGFKEFLDYVRTSGPKVADLAAAIGNALVDIGQAVAPLGGPVLDTITRLVQAFGAIADSPLGPALAATATAMSVTSLATKGYQASLAALGVQAGATAASMAKLGQVGSLVALAALLPQVEKSVDSLFGSFDIENQSALGRDLETLFQTGDAVGEIENLSTWVAILDDNMAQLTDTSFGWVPFDDTSLNQAEESLSKIDAELASMVESGNGEKAAKIFADITRRAAEQGTSSDQLSEIFTEYSQALDNTAAATDNAAAGLGRMSAASMRARAGMQAARKAAQDTANAFVNFANSLSPKEFSLKEWLGQIERQTRALRDFRINAIKAGENGVKQGLINHLKQLGPEGAVQLDRLATANENMVKRANGAWRSFQQETKAGEESVRGAGRAINDLPKSTNLRIDVASNAGPAAASTRAALSGIPDEQVWINVTRRITGSSLGPRNEAADGATVPKTGKTYADRHPYLLADGEEVISNRHGQADRHRSLLKAINAGRLAEGGTAGWNPMGSNGPQWIPMGGGNPLPEALRRNEGEKLREWLKRLNKALSESEKALEKERKQRDAVAAKMKALGADVQTGIRSDLYGGENNPWGSQYAAGSPGDVMSTLRTDVGEARQMSAAIKELRSKGLSGAALASILAEGGLAAAQAWAQLPRAELTAYMRLFSQREQALRNVGDLAGNAAYGDALAQENKELRQANRELKAINAATKRVEKAIEREHKKDRDNSKRGSGNSSRNRNRGGNK